MFGLGLCNSIGVVTHLVNVTLQTIACIIDYDFDAELCSLWEKRTQNLTACAHTRTRLFVVISLYFVVFVIFNFSRKRRFFSATSCYSCGCCCFGYCCSHVNYGNVKTNNEKTEN